MADPLVNLAAFQEKVQGDASAYEAQGIVGAAQQIGALPERITQQNARLVEIAAQRMRMESVQQQMQLHSQELDLRAKSISVNMMHAQTGQQIAAMRKDEIEADRKRNMGALMKEHGYQWMLDEGTGEASRYEMSLTPQGRPNWKLRRSKEARDIELAREAEATRAKGRRTSSTAAERLDWDQTKWEQQKSLEGAKQGLLNLRERLRAIGGDPTLPPARKQKMIESIADEMAFYTDLMGVPRATTTPPPGGATTEETKRALLEEIRAGRAELKE